MVEDAGVYMHVGYLSHTEKGREEELCNYRCESQEGLIESIESNGSLLLLAFFPLFFLRSAPRYDDVRVNTFAFDDTFFLASFSLSLSLYITQVIPSCLLRPAVPQRLGPGLAAQEPGAGHRGQQDHRHLKEDTKTRAQIKWRTSSAFSVEVK